ncbi:hypothetical protein BO70DRAFT_406062 [Aspergillus heteromorphus CBS 117.55]|uniref:Uncharacterized protein n=1 Tax=Aspergillus heteromorphus CBS 117.55 TaxID=1448321 RepID=A0A317W718_9EURO|nr:uncharacterized protein BO70DRAFT_406062 [Aspergillus heteromorphus CBS 117.55]PWY81859.1 hypothetical protein BO70DRAFT_406062 [Aspergillus heteromorphus CBS 117.55]
MDEHSESSDAEDLNTASPEGRFGELLDIPSDSIVIVAINTRREFTTNTFTSAALVKRIEGARSLIHIVEFDDKLRYVVRLPFSGGHDRYTDIAKGAFVAKVKMMQVIKKRTHFPMPEIYDFDASFENEIEAPYVVESFIPGNPISDVWFEESGLMPLEEKRLRILDSVADTMAQLRGHQFDLIGAIEANNRGHQMTNPCHSFKISDSDMWYEESGPYSATVTYMLSRMLDPPSKTPRKKEAPPEAGCRMFLEMMVLCLPLSTDWESDDRESFVLSVPHFDASNILIDDQLHVTGFIDWDEVKTMPRFLGFASFPNWITRDLDPVVYNYPEDEHEDSPELLTRYRLLYNRKMKSLLHGEPEVRFMNKSHIFGAIYNAIMNPTARMEIVRTLVAKAFPTSLDGATRLIIKAGDGTLLRQDKERLNGGFEALLSVQY